MVCQAFVLTGWERPAFLILFTLHGTAGASAMHATQWHRHPEACRAKDPWDNFIGGVHSCPSVAKIISYLQTNLSQRIPVPSTETTYLPVPSEPQRKAQLWPQKQCEEGACASQKLAPSHNTREPSRDLQEQRWRVEEEQGGGFNFTVFYAVS